MYQKEQEEQGCVGEWIMKVLDQEWQNNKAR